MPYDESRAERQAARQAARSGSLADIGAPTAPAAPTDPRGQQPDRWGRPPGHPQYGQPPAAPTTGTAPPGPATPPGTTTPPQGTAPPATGIRGAWTGVYDLTPVARSGVAQQEFTNWDRALSGGDAKSTKDLFARTIQQPGIGDQDLYAIIGEGPDAMARAEKFSRDVVVPKLIAGGADVLDIKNDKILIRTHENPDGEWVDVYGGAGGKNPQFYWGSNGSAKAAPGTPNMLTPQPGVNSTQPVPGAAGPTDPYGSRDRLVDPTSDPTLMDLAYLYTGGKGNL